MKLRYHQKTFDLLNREPIPFDLAPIWLSNLASEIDCWLPPAVREWYSIKDSHEILREFSNDDWPISLEALGTDHIVEDVLKPNSLVTHTLLVIIYENQGACLWAVQLNDSDDSPVYARWKDTNSAWHRLADHFSDFIYSWIAYPPKADKTRWRLRNLYPQN